MKTCPDMSMEKALHARGHRLIAGVDEVGRGALAGPVAAGAVILPPDADFPWLEEVRDSKQLTAAQRERLAPLIMQDAVAFATGVVASEVIDLIGIAPATRDAMRQAVKQLSLRPGFVLIDYVKIPRLGIPQKGVVNGDESCLSIACASIIAKVARDAIMKQMDEVYPGYGFAQHKGYGTADHVSHIQDLGPCAIHRTSFAPLTDNGSKMAPTGEGED